MKKVKNIIELIHMTTLTSSNLCLSKIKMDLENRQLKVAQNKVKQKKLASKKRIFLELSQPQSNTINL